MGEPTLQVNELVSFDIVLTSYDVLKDDLSHDSDRHDGDRRLMRYQKRLVLNLCLFVCLPDSLIFTPAIYLLILYIVPFGQDLAAVYL